MSDSIITIWRAEIAAELDEARTAVAEKVGLIEQAEATLAAVAPVYAAAEAVMLRIGRHEIPGIPLADRFEGLKNQHGAAVAQLRMHRVALKTLQRRVAEWSSAVEQIDAAVRPAALGENKITDINRSALAARFGADDWSTAGVGSTPSTSTLVEGVA